MLIEQLISMLLCLQTNLINIKDEILCILIYEVKNMLNSIHLTNSTLDIDDFEA